MQKNNINASILIWAIFLSLIISVSFISISTKINKNLRNNSLLIDNIKTNSEIKTMINSWALNNSITSIDISNWEKIIFEDNSDIIFWIKKWETHTWKIIEDSNITINIVEWSAIYYKNNTNSWIILSWNSFNWTIWDLYIESLWWYSKVNIKSDSKNNILSQYRNYKIIKKIWNKELIKTKWQIQNF